MGGVCQKQENKEELILEKILVSNDNKRAVKASVGNDSRRPLDRKQPSQANIFQLFKELEKENNKLGVNIEKGKTDLQSKMAKNE